VKAFKRDLLAKDGPRYNEILQGLNAMKDNSFAAKEFLSNPKQLLLAHNLGSTRRAQIHAEVKGLGVAGLATLAQRAVAHDDWDMAAVVCSVVDQMPRDQRPDFSTGELAKTIAGPTCDAVSNYLKIVDRAFAEAMVEYREFTQEKITAHDRIRNALDYRDVKSTSELAEGLVVHAPVQTGKVDKIIDPSRSTDHERIEQADLEIWMSIQGSQCAVQPACIVVVKKKANSYTSFGGFVESVEEHRARQVLVPYVVLNIECSLGGAGEQRSRGEGVTPVGKSVDA
jgi:hypothetical protein